MEYGERPRNGALPRSVLGVMVGTDIEVGMVTDAVLLTLMFV